MYAMQVSFLIECPILVAEVTIIRQLSRHDLSWPVPGSVTCDTEAATLVLIPVPSSVGLLSIAVLSSVQVATQQSVAPLATFMFIMNGPCRCWCFSPSLWDDIWRGWSTPPKWWGWSSSPPAAGRGSACCSSPGPITGEYCGHVTSSPPITGLLLITCFQNSKPGSMYRLRPFSCASWVRNFGVNSWWCFVHIFLSAKQTYRSWCCMSVKSASP